MNDTIYSAEQIQIPAQLPEILKNYSKAVLAEYPADLIDFSIKYFGMLKSLNPSSQRTTFYPNLDQIHDLYRQIKDKPQTAQLEEIARIAPAFLVDDLRNWIQFGKTQLNLSSESAATTITLMLCLIETYLYDVLSSAFFIFRVKPGVIAKESLVAVFEVLCKFDYRVEKGTIDVINGLDGEVLFDDLIRMLGVRK